NRQREIPRRDCADDADRLAGHFHLDARTNRVELVAGEAQRFTREELEDVARASGLADAVGERLALLTRQQPSQLFLARENLRRGAIEDVEPLLRRGPRPLLERVARGGDCLIELARRATRKLTDNVAGVRRIDVGRALGGVDRAAVDVVRES